MAKNRIGDPPPPGSWADKMDAHQYHRQTPATPEFRKWFDEVVNELLVMTRKIVETDEQHVPVMFIFEKHSKRVAMIPLPMFFENGTGKDVAAHLHRTVGQDTEKVDGAMLVVETWMLTADADEALKHYKHGDLGKHPKRKEAMMFNCIRGNMQLMAMYQIRGKGKTRRLDDKPTAVFDNGEPSSQMTGRFMVADRGKLDG